MDIKEKIQIAKTKGISIKLLSELTGININTLYGYTSGKRNLSPEKEEKILQVLQTFNI